MYDPMVAVQNIETKCSNEYDDNKICVVCNDHLDVFQIKVFENKNNIRVA